MVDLEKHILYILVYVILAAVLIIGLHGNVLVMYVLHHRSSRIKKVANLYMVNLAVANSCFLAGVVFFFGTLAYSEYHPYGVYMCWLRSVAYHVLPFTIGALMAVMNVDQVLFICRPGLAKSLRTAHASTVVSFVIWLISGVVSTPIFLYTDVANSGEGGSLVCVDTWRNDDRPSYTTYWFLAGFAIPVPLCVVVNVFAIANGRRQHLENDHRGRDAIADVRIGLLLVLLHIFCWLPYWAFQFSKTNDNFKESIPPVVSHVLWIITKCLTYVNSATSPILFAVMSRDFKRSCLEVCTCCSIPQKNSEGPSSTRRHEVLEDKTSEYVEDKYELSTLMSNDNPGPREVVT